MSVSVVERYEAERNLLISQDRAWRADKCRGPLTDVEIAADAAMRKLRAAEAESVWGAEHLNVPHVFPGMEFLSGRNIIIQTKLFQLLEKMPKGGLLHCHLDAMVDVEYLLKLALAERAMHVRVSEPITASNIRTILPEFSPLPAHLFSKDEAGIAHAEYTPNTFVPLQIARETFDPELGGPEAFDRFVLDAITINPAEAYGTHNTNAKIWSKFERTFEVAYGMIRYAPIYAAYVKKLLLSSIDDGISYVEARIAFLCPPEGHDPSIPLRAFTNLTNVEGYDVTDNREILLIVERVIQEVKDEMKSQGRENEFIGAKVIYCGVRFITPGQLQGQLEECIALKKRFPHLIAGFDLVGDENALFPLKHYVKELLWFQDRQKEEGLDIPFVFHAGETLGDGTDADMNLIDAILLGTKRIGHGFSLVKHPKIMEICRTKEIALEVCPISNEILRLTSSMPMHPLPILFNHGIKVALSSDDPSVFSNQGLTFDFYQVLVSSEVTGLIQLGEVASDSLKYSLMEPDLKRSALEIFHEKWLEYMKYVVEELS
ncbi:hypothetical protein C8J56DRAFT_956260 [Mycena floridula]|nr:hypothetical protein C8J56DRAFT_956260 [Mycena floridula]